MSVSNILSINPNVIHREVGHATLPDHRIEAAIAADRKIPESQVSDCGAIGNVNTVSKLSFVDACARKRQALIDLDGSRIGAFSNINRVAGNRAANSALYTAEHIVIAADKAIHPGTILPGVIGDHVGKSARQGAVFQINQICRSTHVGAVKRVAGDGGVGTAGAQGIAIARCGPCECVAGDRRANRVDGDQRVTLLLSRSIQAAGCARDLVVCEGDILRIRNARTTADGNQLARNVGHRELVTET